MDLEVRKALRMLKQQPTHVLSQVVGELREHVKGIDTRQLIASGIWPKPPKEVFGLIKVGHRIRAVKVYRLFLKEHGAVSKCPSPDPTASPSCTIKGAFNYLRDTFRDEWEEGAPDFDQAATILLQATEQFRASVSLSPSMGVASLEPASDSSQVARVTEE